MIWQKSLKYLSFHVIFSFLAATFDTSNPVARKLQIERVKAEAERGKGNEREP